MSFKAMAQQDGDKYVLAPIKTMKAPVIAFLSPELFEATD